MVAITTCHAAAATALRPLRAVILGAPASGKGTVSSRIVQQFDVAHISSGDKLRFHVSVGSDLGKEVKKYMDNGSFVPDNTMISLIGNEIGSMTDRNWLLDGFPRTLTQAERLQRLHPINLVLNLVVPTIVILDRVKSRWVHMPSGRVYNIGFNDPRVPGKDDITGELLCQREDDKPEVVQKRLQDYAMKTEPVLQFYREIGILREFHGNTTNEMWPAIRNCVAQYCWSSERSNI
ncbi:PREDICTED: GTP:AMP phosphotransferase AK3, mitochondrial [Atta cephalotes]|uniref:GTP:AMP phosphotransferase, mitochondrial n=2 Tax=Atta TaxID=12956 RepID=A0A158NSA6_ATTCE|nr:PREDICTED: GTP:AMP phosphotransferase AK3, mitochondrial [Atta cephalotes]XP_018059898.1 PREDICTED: GTP:AMP phosphotransferase AK3, mitochondrial [Atta colombica]KYM89087.1 GTP:AMP phosphotransferase, mitochondrial [Atta colombica]